MAPNGSCLISADTVINGRISGDEDVTVEGTVEGTISLESELIVADGGSVVADVEVETATVRGRLDGEIVVRGAITLEPGCRVTGNIRSPRVIIEEGARFKGNIDMDVEMPEVE
jgi:cytoskeletal protein CcmA (bactofilin family)